MTHSWYAVVAAALAACGPDAADSMKAERCDLTTINQPNLIGAVGFAPDGAPLVSAQYGAGASSSSFANHHTLRYSFDDKRFSVFGPASRCLGIGPLDTTYFCQVVQQSGSVVEQHVHRMKEGGALESLSDDPSLPVLLAADAEGNFYAYTLVGGAFAFSVKLRAETAFTPVLSQLTNNSGRAFVSQDGAVVYFFDVNRALYRSVTPTRFEKVIDFTTLENAQLSGLTPGAISTDGTFYFFEARQKELWKLAAGGQQLVKVTTVPHGFTLSNVMVDRRNRVYAQVRTTDGSTLDRAGEVYEFTGSSWKRRLQYAGAVSHPAIAPNGSAFVFSLQPSGIYTDIIRFGE